MNTIIFLILCYKYLPLANIKYQTLLAILDQTHNYDNFFQRFFDTMYKRIEKESDVKIQSKPLSHIAPVQQASHPTSH